jgi:hypothetical protein
MIAMKATPFFASTVPCTAAKRQTTMQGMTFNEEKSWECLQWMLP